MPKIFSKFLRNIVLLVLLSKFISLFGSLFVQEVDIQLHDTYIVAQPIFIIIPTISLVAYLLSFIHAGWHRFERFRSNQILAFTNLIFSLVSGYLFFYLQALAPGLLSIVSTLFITSLCTLVLVVFKIRIR